MIEHQNKIMSYKNLVYMLQSSSETENIGVTFINGENEEKFVSYRQIYSTALFTLHGLQAKGMKYGDELIFQIAENETFIYVFWACLIGGIIPVPITVGNTDEKKLKVFKIWNILKRPYMITDSKTFTKLGEFADKNSINTFEEMKTKCLLYHEVEGLSCKGAIFDSQPSDVAFIQFSSGSTGEPKGVVLTHENLLTNINGIINGIECTEEDSCLSWMPLTHDMGLIGFHIAPIAARINQFIMPTNLFIRRPILWMKKASEHKLTILSSPNFGYKYFMTYFKPQAAEGWDFSNIRVIFNGAEPISARLCNEFLDAMSSYGMKKNAMFPVYGLAEASLAVAFPPVDEELAVVNLDRNFVSVGQRVRFLDISENNIDFVNLGYPVENCFMRICDQDNKELDEKIVGFIQIKGKNVTGGYYNREDINSEFITKDGWLNTGDLGFINDGRIILTGRAKDIIFINGQNYYPHDIERVVEETGIRLGEAAAASYYNDELHNEEINLYIYFKKTIEEFYPLVLRIKDHVFRKIGLNIKNVIPIKRIPKTTSGKIQRYKLKEMYESGEFDDVLKEITEIANRKLSETVVEEAYNEVEKQLLEICKKVFGVNEISVHSNFMELGGNSLLLTQVYAQLEELYPDKVKVMDLFTYPTISKLAKFIIASINIKIKAIELPLKYFKNYNDNGNIRIILQEVFEGKTARHIRGVAESEQVSLYCMMLSIFIYLLSEITESRKLPLMVNKGQERVAMLNFDISGTSDFTTLFNLISKQYSDNDATTFLIEDLGKIMLDKCSNSVVFAFVGTSTSNMSERLINVCDVVCEVAEVNDSISVLLNFNSSLLTEGEINKFKSLYLKIIESILEQYDCEEE